MMMIFDEDDVLISSPRRKFFDIIYNANKNLVEAELEALIERMACMEIILDEYLEKDGKHDLLQVLKSFKYSNEELVENKKNSLYIEFVGDVVTKNE